MTDLDTLAAKALVSPAELAALIKEQPDRIRILDASYSIGVGGLAPDVVFSQMRIGAAQFFDIDAVADHSNPLPHMLPNAHDFAAAVSAMGIGNDHLVVVYDQTGIVMSACRAWWMFRVFGHDRVCVLDGGVPSWHEAGLPFATGEPESPSRQNFTATYRPELVAGYEDMKSFVEDRTAMILDARPPERFAGIAPEPRPGMKAGHMPGSRNLPAGALIEPRTRALLEAESVTAHIDSLEIQPNTPVITTCGSGVTACVVALALFKNGYVNTRVYDGSWSEWGQQEFDSQVIKGFE